VLKFKYLYWYSQPLTFRFTLRRFGGGGGGGGGEWRHTSIMNPLSLGERCYNAVVYPFLNYVNHADVRVFDASSSAGSTDDNHVLRFERIAAFLSRPETQIITPGRRLRENVYIEGMCIPSDTLRIILSQQTFGLSPFIGLFYGATQPRAVDDGGESPTPTPIKGVSIITPRIMMTSSSSSSSSGRSVSIYMCDYLAWERYTVSDRQSLELLETTEYIQKSREIAGEQTLYRYREIPWFVIPFTTVYTYMFRMATTTTTTTTTLGNGLSVVRVSSVNMAVFYSFVNECSRDFRCCIFNELTQLQSLVTHGIYHIYMLLFNDVRVIAAYIFAPSWTAAAKVSKRAFSENTAAATTTTKSNRISNLHNYISVTSTALVKYIPPVITPQYDAFGKRIPREKKEGAGETAGSGAGHRRNDDVLLLMSSIQHSSLCDKRDFVAGFQYAAAYHHTKTNLIMIDTLAHNYRLIDYLAESRISIPSAWKLLSRDKWYYILYNAIIHDPTLCKDILMI
jgi:hypothetical protein